MTVGFGAASTVAYLLPALARREFVLSCVATSPATFENARKLGLDMQPPSGTDHLDLAIDGTDQVDPAGRLVKGGGAAPPGGNRGRRRRPLRRNRLVEHPGDTEILVGEGHDVHHRRVGE